MQCKCLPDVTAGNTSKRSSFVSPQGCEPIQTGAARVCQMLQRRTHLRAPSSHHRGVNPFKLVPPARGYSRPCCYELLHSSPVVEPTGMTSSVPCPRAGVRTLQTLWRQLHNGHVASKRPKDCSGGWMRGGRRRRGGGGGETESEGGIHSLGWMRETEQRGGG